MNHHPIRRAVRALRVAALLAAPCLIDAGAQPGFPLARLPFPFAGAMALPGTDDLAQAQAALAAGRHEDAAAAYERALAAIDAGRMPSFGLNALLPAYATALMALNRLDDAERVLQRAIAQEPPRAAGNRIDGYEAMRQLRAAMALASEGADQLNRAVIIEGEDGDPRAAAGFGRDRLPQTREPVVLLAEVRARQGRKDAVRSLYTDSSRTLLERAGQSSSADAPSSMLGISDEAALMRFGVQLAVTQNHDLAEDAFARARKLNFARLERLAGTSPLLDVQLAGFRQRRLITSAYLSTGFARPLTPGSARAMVGAIADSKGLASRYATTLRSLVATSDDPLVRSARPRIEALEREQLDIPTSGAESMAANVDWANRHFTEMQPLMPALRRAGLGGIFVSGEHIVEQAQQRLGDAALIGFAQYRPLDLQTQQFGAPRYVRYVLLRSSVSVEDLGPQREIDDAVSRWRAAIDSSAALPSRSNGLSELLLKGLPEQALRARRWFVDTDGLVSLLPFEALSTADGQPVLARHTVSYLSSLQQFASSEGAQPRPPATGRMVVLADPDFGPARRAQDARPFAPLPETRDEARAVAQAMSAMGIGVELKLGKEARAEALRFAQAPRMLHIATHGFLLATPTDEDEPVSRYRINLIVPGRLAGLALSGPGGSAVLHASELAGLNLRGTELVVLSGCDTGNGLTDVGEGLASLRRAAEEAGAAQAVSSLWPVPSADTVRLMTDFYGALARGESAPAALQSAKQRLREAGAPVRAWAGFVVAGRS